MNVVEKKIDKMADVNGVLFFIRDAIEEMLEAELKINSEPLVLQMSCIDLIEEGFRCYRRIGGIKDADVPKATTSEESPTP